MRDPGNEVEEFEKADFAYVDEKHLENGAYQKRWGGESHECRDYFLKQKFKLNEVIAAFLNFSR